MQPSIVDAGSWRRRLLIFAIAYVIAVGVLTASAAGHNWPVLVGGAAVLAAAGVALQIGLSREPPPPLPWRTTIAQATMLLGIALVVAWQVTRLDGLGFAGAVTVFFGLGQLMAALRQQRDQEDRRLVAAAVIVGMCGATMLVGLAYLGSETTWPAIACIAAVLLAPIGLQLLSEEAIDRDWFAAPSTEGDGRARRRSLLLWAGSVLLVVAGCVGLALTGVGWLFPVVVTIVLFLLVGTIASDTNADMVAVALIALVLLGVTAAPVALPERLMPAKGERVVVVLGDSYTSGEGAAEYYEHTNEPGVNECRRSTHSYGGRIELGDRPIVFVACSGAVATEIWQDPQSAQEPVDWPASPPGTDLVEGLPQIASVERHNVEPEAGPGLDLKPDLVVIGVGGNDASFGDIAQACVAPGDCSEIGGHWLAKLPDALEGIDRAFDEIRTSPMLAGVPVLVVPYPVPIRDESCDWSAFTADEHRFLNRFTMELNTILEVAAARHSFMFLRSMGTLFEDKRMRICDGGPESSGVNLIARDSVAGALEDTSSILKWTHNSMHPKENGQDAMTVLVNDWLAKHPNLDDDPPTTRDYTPKTIDDLMGDDFEPEPTPPGFDPTQWQLGQVRTTLIGAGLPLLLVVGGSAVIWLSAITRWRNRSGSPVSSAPPTTDA